MVRRTAPQMLISWTRALAGRFTDPMVGRDLLLGTLAGIAGDLIGRSENALPWWMNVPGSVPGTPPRQFLGTSAEATGMVFNNLWQSVLIALLFVFVFIGARVLLRNRWAAAAFLMLFLGFQDVVTSSTPWITLLFTLFAAAAMVAPIVLLGPLAAAVAFLVGNLVSRVSGIGVAAWYAPRSWGCLLLIAAIAVYGFRCAVAGRPLFGGEEAHTNSAR
jgi:hypothetical protein